MEKRASLSACQHIKSLLAAACSRQLRGVIWEAEGIHEGEVREVSGGGRFEVREVTNRGVRRCFNHRRACHRGVIVGEKK